MRDEALYLDDIVDACDALLRFVAGRNIDNVLTDEVLSAAILQKFGVIGEAASRLPPRFRDRHASIPWRDAIDMRNVVVHHYFGVNWLVVWRTIHEDIPRLRQQVAHIVETEFGGPVRD